MSDASPGPRGRNATLKAALRPAVRAFRRVAGPHSRLEERVKRRFAFNYKSTRGPGFVEWQGSSFTIVQSTATRQPNTGIYLKGACDLPSLLRAGPLLRDRARGTVAVARARGGISYARADILLQTLEEIPPELTAETRERLRLKEEYFTPSLFDPTFTIAPHSRLGAFPKTVVVLSLAPNVVRTVYRHRDHGFLVDPGGWWLNQSYDQVLREQDRVEWFRKSFQSIGRLSVEEFYDLFAKTVTLVRQRAGASHILVYNVLTVEPGDQTHNYQLRKHPEGMRRREFCVALAELSQQLGFHVVDIDRVLKQEGAEGQVDFAHFPTELYTPIAREAVRILRELEVV